MRRASTLAVLATLLAQPLAGCGRTLAEAPAPVRAKRPTPMAQGVARRTDADFLAARLRTAGWSEVGVTGSIVAARNPQGSLAVFDLADTARTGEVKLTCDGTVLSVPYDRDAALTDDAAAIVVAVTARMLLGGAQAFVNYWLNHRGDAFDRRECAAAVAAAMVTAATTLVPRVGPLLSQLLAPVVRKWVERWIIGPRSATLGGVLLSARAEVPAVAQAFAKAFTEQQRLARAGAR
ncbi:MAG: hypothetical protein VKQ33_13215 [Candidatus Sericytochromatia bacterium]|nr:hypothetical protein [Candidatus Sericytochromatia bacterium]